MRKGSHMTAEQCAKIKAGKIGHPGYTGQPHSQETIAKLRAARLVNNPMKGNQHSEETKAKMRAAAQSRPHTGEQATRWQGGRHVDNKGRVFIHMPGHPNAPEPNYILEHRLVMEQHLGRYLRSDEHVHHINHNRGDNRLENLMLLSRGEHSRLHRQEECAALGSAGFAAKLRCPKPPRQP